MSMAPPLGPTIHEHYHQHQQQQYHQLRHLQQQQQQGLPSSSSTSASPHIVPTPTMTANPSQQPNGIASHNFLRGSVPPQGPGQNYLQQGTNATAGPSSYQMGPPGIAVAPTAGGGPPMAAVGPSPVPSGAAVLKLMQFFDGMSGIGSINEPDITSLNYWRSFVSEFFMPDGCYRQVVYSPAIGEQRAFELPVSVLARYLHTLHLSGCTSHSMTLTHTREYPPGALGSIPPPPASQRPPSSVLGAAGQPNATTTHFVQVNRARMLAGYENGWSVLHTGTLRAGLTTVSSSSTTMLGSSSGSGGVDLKFQFIDFHIREHESLVSKNRIQRGGVEQVLPEELVNKIRGKTSGNKAETKKEQRDREKREASNAAGGGGGGDQDDKSGIVKNGSCTDEEKYTLPIERLTLPDNPINEYGMTLRSMRCLEITESVCQLRDLMEYSAIHKLGPMQALKRLAEDFRTNRAAATTTTTQGGELYASPDAMSATGGGSNGVVVNGLKRKGTADTSGGGPNSSGSGANEEEEARKRLR